jgi:O-methyltransferase involved in polyketide biosynthesis
MNQMAIVSGDILEGVSAVTPWTLHNRGTEAKRFDGVIRDPSAVVLFDTISYDYRKFGRPNQAYALREVAFDTAARNYLTTSRPTRRRRWWHWPRGRR